MMACVILNHIPSVDVILLKGNMKKALVILIATLFITLTVKAQNLFFIGQSSYPCLETISLQANSESVLVNDLELLFAKEGTKKLIVVSTRTSPEVFISGKLIIYLDDGTVITCQNRVAYDYLDHTAKFVYSLTNEDLSKMKNSNINTARYSLKRDSSSKDEKYSASNKGSSTKTLISEFYDD